MAQASNEQQITKKQGFSPKINIYFLRYICKIITIKSAMLSFKLFLVISSTLPIQSALGFSMEEKPIERKRPNSNGYPFSSRLHIPRFRRTYKNSNEFRYRKNKRYRNFFSHEIEKSPMDFTDHDPLRFHVEANYDDPLWPNTFGLNFNANRGNRQWYPRRFGFRRRMIRDTGEYDETRMKTFPKNDPKKYVDFKREMEQNEDTFRKNSTPRKLSAKYKRNHKDRHSENEVANHEFSKEDDTKERLQPYTRNKGYKELKMGWFIPSIKRQPAFEDDIEEDYPPQALIAFLHRHKLNGNPDWGENSDPHQGLKSVKIIRPHGDLVKHK